MDLTNTTTAGNGETNLHTNNIEQSGPGTLSR